MNSFFSASREANWGECGRFLLVYAESDFLLRDRVDNGSIEGPGLAFPVVKNLVNRRQWIGCSFILFLL
jgi:hypothetical protein